MSLMRDLLRENILEMKGRKQAADNLDTWCSFLGKPCGACHFSVPPYDEDEGCFVEGVEVCALRDIALDGDEFKGYKLPKEKIDELADRG